MRPPSYVGGVYAKNGDQLSISPAKKGEKASVAAIVEFALRLSCPCLFSATRREDSESSTSALAAPGLEQLYLRVLEEVAILQNRDDLEQVGFLIVAVDFDLVDQVRQHGVEGNDRVHVAGTLENSPAIH